MGVELLIQFATVFLGAFLAFWLENLRERRQLRSWLHKYLKDAYANLKKLQATHPYEIKTLKEIVNVFARLSQEGSEVSEDDWKILSARFGMKMNDSTFLLSGEPLNVLEPELVHFFQRMEETVALIQTGFGRLQTLQNEHVLPIYLEQPDELNDQHRRVMKLMENVLEDMTDTLETFYASLPEATALLERHGYHR